MPKRVTKEEWKEISHRLYGKLDDEERVELEKFFRADMEEEGIEVGITKEEFESGISWLRSNAESHELEESDLQLIEKYFQEHLKD